MNCIQRTLYTATGEPMVAEKEFSFQREDSLPQHVEGGGFTATIVATEDGGYQKKLSSCFVEQIIRAIRPGARRIGFSRYCSDFLMTAVCNPGGMLAVAVLNAGNADSCANIRVDGWIGKADFPAGTISTLILK